MQRYFITVLTFLTIIFLCSSSSSWHRIDYKKAMNKNVCKEFKGNVLLYFIFVDSKETTPWSEFDIQSTLDSIHVATQWLKEKARENQVNLVIKYDHHIGDEYTTVRKNLPMGSVELSATEPNFRKGLDELNNWADNIARRAGMSLNIIEKEGIQEMKNPKDKERLVAYLRDMYQVENVGLFYMVNNYFKEDLSIPINFLTTEDVEFAVISYKYPAEIVHNVLHLFGAADLYKTPYRRDEKKIRMAKSSFPKAVMLNPRGKNLTFLELSPVTRYLIGWDKKLDKKYNELLTDKIINF